MNLKASIAATLLGLVAGVGCSSSSSPTTSEGAVAPTSTTVAPAKWTAEAKSGVRQLMAMAAQGSQLDCAVDVTTSVYSPEDWTYALAHGAAGEQLPARMKDLDSRSRQELERRCGIKDTSAAMKAWNAAVDEWNALTKKRDATGASTVVVGGQSFESYTDWAKAFGKPLEMPN